MDGIEELMERKYGIKADSIEKMKNIYKIRSGRDVYSLKKIKYEKPHFLFILGAMNHLIDRGFHWIMPFMPTLDGKCYVELDGGFGYVNEWINARVANYDNPLDVDMAAKKLAELHLYSRNFETKPWMKPRIGWMTWKVTYNTRLDEIQDFKRRIEAKRERTHFDEVYYNAIEKNMTLGIESLKRLEDTEYENIMNEEKQFNGFCHHDYAHHNILIDDRNEATVIDFDYCILDTHLHDLSSLLIRVMKNEKWDIDMAIMVLDSYSSIYPLKNKEIPIMADFMMFPQEFWQIGIQYYWEKQKWDEDFFERKLQKILDDMDPRYDFLDSFEKIQYGG